VESLPLELSLNIDCNRNQLVIALSELVLSLFRLKVFLQEFLRSFSTVEPGMLREARIAAKRIYL
jgi:hypothetical protein